MGDSPAPPSWRVSSIAFTGMALVFAVQYTLVKPTNFGGFDEWLILSLNSRGLWSFPHSNRPFQLAWTAPAVWLSPCSFAGYYLVHGAYLLTGGLLLFQLARRIFAGSNVLAFLASVIGVAWAPLDMFRLDVVQASSYSAVLMGALLALLLFVTSVERENAWLLVVAGALAFFTARSYEGTLGLLFGAPLLLPFASGSRRWRFLASVSFETVVALALALAARPLLAQSAETLYQSSVLGADLNPARYLDRLLLQFWLSLRPVVPEGWARLEHLAVAIGSAALVGFGLLVARLPGERAWVSRRRLAAVSGLGVVLAALGYSVIVVSARVVNASRTQILSAPGIAVFLTAVIGLVASLVPGRRRMAVVLAAGAWIVGVGTAQTIGIQNAWDSRSLYTAQVASLRKLVAQAPQLKEGTLVVLIDESGTWPMSFTFRHALSVIYPEKVVGHVLGADQIFYALVARPDGLESVPWPVLRGPWKTEPTHHAYDETVAFRLTPSGDLVRLDTWEHPRLPPLPPGARYEPAARRGPGSILECTRRLLEIGPP